jgi:isovaleryl-CoA dehydrogenase
LNSTNWSHQVYRLDDEQQKIIGRIREIASDVIAKHAADVDERGRFPVESMQALGEAGFHGLLIPQELGGMAQGLRTLAAAIDEIARQCASTAMVAMMHHCGVNCYLADPERFGDVIRASAAGNHLSTLAFSEKGSRSHFWAPVSRAAHAGDGEVLLSAEKSWVTSAGYADGMVCSTGSASGDGASVFLVLKDDDGLSLSGGWNSLGMRGNQSNPMRLENVRLRLNQRLIGEDGQGADVMLGRALPVFLVCQAAIGNGLAEASVHAALRHVTTANFRHLGTKLMDLPNLRANLAQMRMETDRARAYLEDTLHRMESGQPESMNHLLAVKASSSETAVAVSDLAMRTCGGAAFSKQLGLERTFRDSRAAIVMAPTTDHLREFAGRLMVGLPLFG